MGTGNTLPFVVVTDVTGKHPIIGFNASNTKNAKAVKAKARELRKLLKAKPGLLKGAPGTEASVVKNDEPAEDELLCKPREFTNIKGKTITAAVVAKTATHVTLRMANGKQAEVPLTSLSDESRAFIAEL